MEKSKEARSNEILEIKVRLDRIEKHLGLEGKNHVEIPKMFRK